MRICNIHNSCRGVISLKQCNFGEHRLNVRKRKREKNKPARTTSYRSLEVGDVLSALQELVSWTNESKNSKKETALQPPICWSRFKNDEAALRGLFNSPSSNHIETIVDSLYGELSLINDDSNSDEEASDAVVIIIIIISCCCVDVAVLLLLL